MSKEPGKKNGSEPKPKDGTAEEQAVWRHIKVLIGIAVVWIILFALMLVEKAGEVRMMLPVIGIAFIGYLIYATYSVLRNRKW